jgi:anti-anti-sigma regulatory factor
MKKLYNIAKLIAPILSSRDVISSNLNKKIKSANTEFVYLDFKDVEFISRSAAHEMILLKENSAKEIYFTNMNKTVEKMFAVVEKSRKKTTQNKIIKFKAEKLDITELQQIAF